MQKRINFFEGDAEGCGDFAIDDRLGAIEELLVHGIEMAFFGFLLTDAFEEFREEGDVTGGDGQFVTLLTAFGIDFVKVVFMWPTGN